MKKQVIAAAVAAAFAVPATAQVTISGVLETAISTTSKNQSSKAQQVMNSGQVNTNAITISATEDLGGGLKAGMRLVTRLASDETAANGAATSSVGEPGITIGDRGAELSISGGFGAITIGKSAGSHMNALQGGFIGSQSLLGAVNIRPDNSIKYSTVSMSGFSAQVLHSLGNEAHAAPKQGSLTEFGLSYAAGPIDVKYANMQNGSVTAPDGNGGLTTSNVSNSAANQSGFAVTYDAGMAKFNLRSIQTTGSNASATEKGKNTGFGVAVPVKGIGTLVADYMNHERDTKTNGFKRYSLGVQHDLSKRTQVYGLYQNVDNNSGVSNGVFGITAANGVDNSGMTIGIVHRF